MAGTFHTQGIAGIDSQAVGGTAVKLRGGATRDHLKLYFRSFLKDRFFLLFEAPLRRVRNPSCI